MPSIQLTIVLTILLGVSMIVQTKHVEGVLPIAALQKDGFKYVTKFGYNYGDGQYTIRFKLSEPIDTKISFHRIHYDIFVDDVWANVLESPTCDEKTGRSSSHVGVLVPKDGSWSDLVTGSVSQSRRPHVWFFAFSDCEKQIPEEASGLKLHYEIHMTNSDGSEFSVEEQGFSYAYLAIMVYMGMFLCFNLNRLRVIYLKEEEMDYAFLALISAIAIELVAIACEFVHLSAYSFDGKGLAFFDMMSQVCSVLSQFVMTCLLVLIAWGWTISFHGLKEWYCYIPIGLLVGVLQVTMIVLNHLVNDEISTKYHEYDNWAGLLIVMIRVGLFGYFSSGIRETSSKSGEHVKPFARKFGVLGSCYLLIFPLLVLITIFVREYMRHKIITIGTIVAQTIGMAVMAYSFSSKKSDYATVSLRGRCSLLPSDKFNKLD